MFRRLCLFLAAPAVALALVPTGAATLVHVRVEGKTRTIFGASQPVIDATSHASCPIPPGGPATPCPPSVPNALDGLLSAADLGEFFVHLTTASFGTYVDQIGRYPAAGQAGWVFKVNGVSPPVGADQVTLHAGDSVLWYWAQFGVAGGPKTLTLRRSGRCYDVVAQDDNGKTAAADGAVLHVGSRRTVATRAGRACLAPHRGLLVRATLAGAVRSNAVP